MSSDITIIIGGSDVMTIISVSGIIISFLAFILSVILVYNTIKYHRLTKFHDLVKWEHELWEEIIRNKKGNMDTSLIASKIINFYEYISYIYLKKGIKRKDLKNYFKGELIKNYELYNKFITEQDNLKKVYCMWKND